MKYRKKPVIVDAFRFMDLETPWPLWLDPALVILRRGAFRHWLELETPEGPLRALEGDWIIRGIDGEIYPCRHDIFEKTYEPVEGEG